MAAFAWIDDSFSLRFALTLLHFLWQGCAVAAFVIAGGVVLKRAPARWRYALNVSALLLMAACVPVTFVMLDRPRSEPVPVSGQLTGLPEHHVQSEWRLAGPVDPSGGKRLSHSDPELTVVSAEAAAVIDESEPDPSPATAVAGFAPLFTVAYFAGVLMMLIRLAIGVRGSYRLRQRAVAIEDETLLAAVTRQAQGLGLRCAPAVAWCEEVSIPVVLGILKPIVLLPAALAAGLSPEQMQALITHELAHIRRFDPFVNMLQRLIEVGLFFHPAAWFVSRRISIERENAADDMVLAAGWKPPHYADALLRMAELSSALHDAGIARQTAMLAASGTGTSDFKRRIMRLVDGPQPSTFRLTRGGLSILTLLLLMLSTPIAVRVLAQPPSAEPARPEQRPHEQSADVNDDSETTENSQPSVTLDKTLLPRVAETFESPTVVHGGYVAGGGIIERIEDNTIHLRSGDRIAVVPATKVVLPAEGDQPLQFLHVTDLEPGMAISWSMRDGRTEKIVLAGIVAGPAPADESAFETIRKLGLRRGNEMNDSLDGRFPIRLTGHDGPVLIVKGATKLIRLPKPTTLVEWQMADYRPEGIEDIESFDYLLVQWRDNGRVTWTCYQSPAIAEENESNE